MTGSFGFVLNVPECIFQLRENDCNQACFTEGYFHPQ